MFGVPPFRKHAGRFHFRPRQRPLRRNGFPDTQLIVISYHPITIIVDRQRICRISAPFTKYVKKDIGKRTVAVPVLGEGFGQL